jgi:hypothetical protein
MRCVPVAPQLREMASAHKEDDSDDEPEQMQFKVRGAESRLVVMISINASSWATGSPAGSGVVPAQ